MNSLAFSATILLTPVNARCLSGSLPSALPTHMGTGCGESSVGFPRGLHQPRLLRRWRLAQDRLPLPPHDTTIFRRRRSGAQNHLSVWSVATRAFHAAGAGMSATTTPTGAGRMPLRSSVARTCPGGACRSPTSSERPYRGVLHRDLRPAGAQRTGAYRTPNEVSQQQSSGVRSGSRDAAGDRRADRPP